MIILGIDPGLAHTGWGVIETRGAVYRARAYGCVATHASEPIDQRLGRIYDGLTEVIELYHPTQLSIEKIFFGENTRSAIATAHARGVAIVACSQNGLALGEYTPMQIKQAVVGTGSADKYQVIYMVRRILALDHDPRPDHCADALAAAICHANLLSTVSFAHRVAKSEVAAAERAQGAYEAELARERTAAATAAHTGGRDHSGTGVTAARRSRRSTS